MRFLGVVGTTSAQEVDWPLIEEGGRLHLQRNMDGESADAGWFAEA